MIIIIVTSCVLLLSLITVWWVYKTYFRLKVRLRHYTKQGLKLDCYEPPGGYFFNRKHYNEQMYGDPFYELKKKIIDEPDAPFYLTHAYDQPCLYMLRPEYVKMLNIDNAENHIKAAILTKPIQRLVGDGLAAGDHPKWKKHRKILTQALHNQYVRKMIPLAYETASDYVQNLKTRVKENGGTLHPNFFLECKPVLGETGMRGLYGPWLFPPDTTQHAPANPTQGI